jgi:hypothetical protein
MDPETGCERGCSLLKQGRITFTRIQRSIKTQSHEAWERQVSYMMRVKVEVAAQVAHGKSTIPSLSLGPRDVVRPTRLKEDMGAAWSAQVSTLRLWHQGGS